MVEHEIYVCYDKPDQKTADAISKVLEDNGIKCWLKYRDAINSKNVDEVVNVIKQSKALVLISSGISKYSEPVRTEVDLAFNDDVPIVVYKVDEFVLDKGFEIFLSNAILLDAYKDSDNQFRNLVTTVSKLLKKPISEPFISDEATKLNEIAVEYNHKRKIKIPRDNNGFFEKFKIPIIAVAIILIVGAGIFAFMNYDDGIGGTSKEEMALENITLKITDFHVDNVKDKNTNWDYSYFVGGTITPLPEKMEKYKIVVDFYDASGTLVDTSQTELQEAQNVNNGYLLGSAVSDSNKIKRVEAQLLNDKDIIVAQAESTIK